MSLQGKKPVSMPRKPAKRKTIPSRNRSPYGWWVASYIQRFEWKDQQPKSSRSRCDAWENTILVRGKTREVAYKKAMAICMSSGPPTWNRHGPPPGRLGRWKPEGLTSLVPVHESIEDGSEILWTEYANTTVGKVKRRVKAKGKLETFQDD